MIKFIKKIPSWILGLFFVLAGVVVYLWRAALREKKRVYLSVTRARVEVELFQARQISQSGAAKALENIEAKHEEKIETLKKTEADIDEAAKDSRAALAALINKSFRR
jgi:hypothetical protein